MMDGCRRFLKACRGEPADRPPIWLMRQAGRCMPEYRRLRQQYAFRQIVRTPELAAEASLQPTRRFGFDAAIVFSDILIVPEALGQPFEIREPGGVEMAWRADSAETIGRLDPAGTAEKLGFLAKAIQLLKTELAGKTALIGFGGAPWTLACYMAEGAGRNGFPAIRRLYYENAALYEELLIKITAAATACLKLQIEAGADAVQIFDTWAALCPAGAYEGMSLRWIQKIISALPAEVPVILFARGMNERAETLAASGAAVLSLDWATSLAGVRRRLHTPPALQGNLDPAALLANPGTVKAEALKILEEMKPFSGHIFNLGHGVLPETETENLEALVETVTSFRKRSGKEPSAPPTEKRKKAKP